MNVISAQSINPVENFISIRGTILNLNELVKPEAVTPEALAALRTQFENAAPFPHIVLDDLISPALLNLVNEEFDLRAANMKKIEGQHESIHRSPPKPKLGVATQLYFNTIHSGWFTNILTEITGVDNLLPDPMLYGGGMHETRKGGRFEIHLDFNKHHCTMLDNEMVLITYLNKDWQPEYNGALELWDSDKQECAKEVMPIFGRTILFKHTPRSLHGHSKPLLTPDGKTRRSIAAYFYSNRVAKENLMRRDTSLFAPRGQIRRLDTMKRFIKSHAPTHMLRIAQSLKNTDSKTQN